MSSKRITHQHIAEHLGVSRAAVTQALHRTRGSTVSPEVRRTVIEAAQKLGYEPRGVTTHNIGFVTGYSALKLAAETDLVRRCSRELGLRGYRLMLSTPHSDDIRTLKEMLSPKTVDGVILNRWFEGRVREVLPASVPWLLTSDENGVPSDVDVVTVDSIQATECITQYLLGLGHERICLVMGSSEGGFHERLKSGVRTALDQADLPEENLLTIEVAEDVEIRALLRQVLSSAQPPTAIIGAGPEKTLTILYLLCQFGLRVPEDISVVSLMDSHLLEPALPGVTATTAGGQELAAQITQRLVEKMNNPALPARHTLVPVQMVVRGSAGPARKMQ